MFTDPTVKSDALTSPLLQDKGLVKTKVVVIFGVGHHARRIYIPTLLKNKQLNDASIVVIDLLEAAPTIQTYIGNIDNNNRVISHFIHGESVQNFEQTLGATLLRQYEIVGIIIATDPEKPSSVRYLGLEKQFACFDGQTDLYI